MFQSSAHFMSADVLHLTLKTELFNGKKYTNIECQKYSLYFHPYKIS